MTETEEKVGKYKICFRVVESCFDRHIPKERTILTGTKQQCLEELRSWIPRGCYLDVLEIEEVK